VATTCLTETIGDDVPMIVNEFRREMGREEDCPDLPALVTVSIPAIPAPTWKVPRRGQGRGGSGDHGRGGGGPGQYSARLSVPGGHPAHQGDPRRFLVSLGHSSGLFMTLDGPALDEYEKIPRAGPP